MVWPLLRCENPAEVDGIFSSGFQCKEYISGELTKVTAPSRECNYESKNCIRLYRAIEREDWPGVSKFLESGCWPDSFFGDALTPSDQSRTWVTRIDPENNDVRWSQLPLHLAIIMGAPYKVVLGLVGVYPEAVRCQDDQNMLPLHLAMRHGADMRVIDLLLSTFPEAIKLEGRDNLLPIDCIIRGTLKARGRVVKALVDYAHETAVEATKCVYEKDMDQMEEQLRMKHAELVLAQRRVEDLKHTNASLEKELLVTKTVAEQKLLHQQQQQQQQLSHRHRHHHHKPPTPMFHMDSVSEISFRNTDEAVAEELENLAPTPQSHPNQSKSGSSAALSLKETISSPTRQPCKPVKARPPTKSTTAPSIAEETIPSPRKQEQQEQKLEQPPIVQQKSASPPPQPTSPQSPRTLPATPPKPNLPTNHPATEQSTPPQEDRQTPPEEQALVQQVPPSDLAPRVLHPVTSSVTESAHPNSPPASSTATLEGSSPRQKDQVPVINMSLSSSSPPPSKPAMLRVDIPRRSPASSTSSTRSSPPDCPQSKVALFDAEEDAKDDDTGVAGFEDAKTDLTGDSFQEQLATTLREEIAKLKAIHAEANDDADVELSRLKRILTEELERTGGVSKGELKEIQQTLQTLVESPSFASKDEIVEIKEELVALRKNLKGFASLQPLTPNALQGSCCGQNEIDDVAKQLQVFMRLGLMSRMVSMFDERRKS